MRVAKIEYESINNGPGVRVVVWCQGCSIQCPGCQNKATWDPCGGEQFTSFDVTRIMKELENPYIQGITFSGGHPLEEYNLLDVICLMKGIRATFDNKDIWLYTGKELTYEDIISDTDLGYCLRLCDVVIDGPYIEELRDITLPYRGSSNQRLIDIKKSMSENKIVNFS